MNPRFKRLALLALLALILAGCDMGVATPTPLPASSPTAQAVATPTTQPDSGGQAPSATSPAERPATTVLPDGDPMNPIDRVPDLSSKQTPIIIPLTPLTTPATDEATPAPTPGTATQVADCTPTRADAEGPFYEPNAPERTSIGKGHVLKGVVMSSAGCRPIPGAQLEFWQVNEQAEYDDDHRATMFADSSGVYSFESNFPQGYSGRPSHIHLRVTAGGYQTLITQFYPQQGETEATFDIVLVEE